MGEFADKLAAQSPAFQRAYLGSLAPSLVKSVKLEQYYETLTDFDFITAKINHPEFGVQPLIEDYDLIDHAETLNYPEYNSEKVKSLKLIQGALRLSAHILVTDKQQLASQLHGRLLNQQMPEEIQALLAQIKQEKTTPWLCPLTPSLTPPGGRLLRTLKGHSSYVNAVAVTPNGQQVISASDDKTLKVWNLATGEEQFTLNGHSHSVNAVAVTPNGQQVISASDDKTLKVWNLATGEEQFTLNGHSSYVNAVAVTPNGQQVISASDDKTLKVWNLATGKEGFFTFIRNLITRRKIFTLKGHSDWVKAVAVTPNGQQVISASYDNTLKVWNLATGEEQFTLNGHSHWVNAVAVTPNGQQVISASIDNTLKVWNLATGEEQFTLNGHSSYVNAVAVTPNGQQVISASYDNTLKVWNLATGEVIATFAGEGSIDCCAVAPDCMTIVAGDSSGRVHFLRLEGMREESRESNFICQGFH
ncbi:hypothetical protein A6V25_12855 [Nostoc sp. ATCC 53789]|nr:PQQ-binding-like beta-propeller repeat protein [Nostoc sp. ATCC 53789]RCJ32269.1 hypothetical protein A6V25_12855 [Nostoc sp. ATCC 53789]